MKQLLIWLLVMGVTETVSVAQPRQPLLPAVEIEENVYTTAPANNGAGPLWCFGSTSLARLGEGVYASGIETLPDQKPLNNVRWMVFQRGAGGWQLMQADPTGRQREPCPLGVWADGRLLLSSNPTLTPPGTYNGSAQPQVLLFDTRDLKAPPQVMLPQWEGAPAFSEHSYRGFTVDSQSREALLLQNVGYDKGYWSFLDRAGEWSRRGVLNMPWGAEFEKPAPIRIAYQQMALRDRAAHIMGISDIIEWVREWREYKLELNGGKTWDYDFRRLYYCWTPDVTAQPFGEWVKVADCDQTCGHIRNLDMWLDPQGRAHLLWLENSVWDKRVRDKFFLEVPQTFTLMYGIIEQGKVVRKTQLARGGEKQASQEIPGWGRFQATPDGRLFVFYYTSGVNAQGRAVSENRLLELYADGTFSPPVRVALQRPLTSFFTASERGGSAPSATLDLLGHASGVDGVCYARINLLSRVRAAFEENIQATAGGSEVQLDGRGSQAVEGEIASYVWQIGDQEARGAQVRLVRTHGGPLQVSLTVADAQGHTNRSTRILHLPPAPADFGLAQWGLVLRIEAEQFVAEGGEGPIRVREDKFNASGLSLSHADPKGLWLEWEFEVPVADTYYLLARYAVPADSARTVYLDGQKLGEMAFPATGGYGSDLVDNWGSVAWQLQGTPRPLRLSAGKHTLRLENENGRGLNLDYLELLATGAPFPAAAVPGWQAREKDGYRWLQASRGRIAPTQVTPELGLCYHYRLGPLYPGDGLKDSPPSKLRLWEDGQELGPAHAVHVAIREQGQGRFSHWHTVLYFSASDNSDPRTNGKKYRWAVE
jgi:hypothetical protein